MSLTEEKKQRIRAYILEKIEQKTPALTAHVAEQFGISQTAVYKYLHDLESENAIRKEGRGSYSLVKQEYKYVFSRQSEEFQDEGDIYAASLVNHLQGLPDNVNRIWNYAFSEMVNNVIDHSMCEKLYAVIRRDSLATSVILHDDGIGIFEKIKSYFGFSSKMDAMQELFKGKLTTDKAHHSGEGIFFTSRLMDMFMIVSDGLIFAIDKYDQKVAAEYKDVRGTFLMMRLSNTSNKETKEVFEQYADPDNGFTITRIPIKNMFDMDPVSRSQAKRMCYRLGDFEEVILDFEGVGWMGQGFAHQVFVVFANENPVIRLRPVNMSEDVRKMYEHVLNT